ncbi:MAG: VacJ family lipoprotein [Gemmatimonadaceae bacterium]|nr:VacJ family lipoprotein [Acetobacteraceae bacterium]
MSLIRVLPLLLLASVAACAPRPPAGDAEALAEYRELNDPLEPTNRFIYRVNDGIDTYALRPAAVAYRTVVPGAVRRPIRNALSNLATPAMFANDVLSGKPRRAGDSLMRFVINSTAGVGGFFDVATDLGYPETGTNFGTTLATWGVGEGPFLFLPVFGPSNPRDATGFAGDAVLDPITWASFGGRNTLGITRVVFTGLDRRERAIEAIDSIKRDALDPYATFRSLSRQSRAEEVSRARVDRPATIPAWFPQPAR